jgi:UDP-N-acetylmuramate dehydrogenase
VNLVDFRSEASLKPFTTLRAGGNAEHLMEVGGAEELASTAEFAFKTGEPVTLLGCGSNVLPSDSGIPGIVIINRDGRIKISKGGEVVVDTGAAFQDLFLKTAQAGLGGLEFAVGIPGSVGGALVSNAGAYRSCISEFLTSIEIIDVDGRRWVEPSYMEFAYRDSVFRRSPGFRAVMLRASFRLLKREPMSIYREARDYQRQRISKQPPGPSAGSFFKNVNDSELAARLSSLPEPLKKAGVVPAGYLIESVGLKGFRHGGAQFGQRHANFILNTGNATASEIRELASIARHRVSEAHGVTLEEEVLYIGTWKAA